MTSLFSLYQGFEVITTMMAFGGNYGEQNSSKAEKDCRSSASYDMNRFENHSFLRLVRRAYLAVGLINEGLMNDTFLPDRCANRGLK